MNIMLQKLRARDLTHVINIKTKDQLLIACLYMGLVFSEVVA